jgi:hypothetical protein
MKLQVGERLEGAGPPLQPGGYVVTSIVRETPWHGLYTGKKIFYNFDFTAKRVRETDDVEWLDVFLRTNRYPILDDPAYVQQRRALARAEIRAVLGNRHSNLWPEPIDLLEVENTRDPFAFADDSASPEHSPPGGDGPGVTVRDGEPIGVWARPHGQFAAVWEKQIVPISSILSVLAELLEFLKQAHAEGLLLLGLAPSSLLIDASDRVHYVGAEMVLAQQSPLLKVPTPERGNRGSEAALWQRLFPADRFARGFSAPECFDPNRRPDVRADLFAWGTLAYSLLTGAALDEVAREQGRPWTTFTETHWERLEKLLAQLPPSSVQAWAKQIGVDPHRLVQDWPGNFLAAFRMLLSPEPDRRPPSCADLLAWLVDPPPGPIAGLIALHTDGDTAKLLLDCTGSDMGLQMTVQCSRNAPARQASDGTTVAQGPLLPVIGVSKLPVTTDSVFYTIFTRRPQDDRASFSPGVSARLWQPNEDNLRQWAEEQAAACFDGHPTPPQVGMVLAALELRFTIESLVQSPHAHVRAWALRRIEQTVHAAGRSELAESLLHRFLADPNAEVRQSAATLFWSQSLQKTDDLVVQLVEALEAPPIDAPIPLKHFLRQLQLSDDRIRAISQQLESRRPTECPLCKKPLTLGERGTHLQAEHGYLYYQGDLLPAQTVLARLWERAFQQQERHAHEELVGRYLSLPNVHHDQEAAVQHYVADLERFLQHVPSPVTTLPPGQRGWGEEAKAESIPIALPYASLLAYQTNLRLSKLFLPIARRLLTSPQPRLRDLGYLAVVPYIQEQLTGRSSVDELRRALNAVSADFDHTDLQIDLCRQLAVHGVDQALVSACIVVLQEERLVVCSECQAEVQVRDLEFHLRRAHQVYQFRGERKTYAETREAILQAVCTPPPDPAAWKSLQGLAEDKHPQETDRYLVSWLYQFIKDVDAGQRSRVITALAEVLIAAQAVERLLPVIAGAAKNASWELLGQLITLEICSRLPGPIPQRMLPLVTPLLDLKELPRRARENAVLALLRWLEKDQPLGANVLRAYVGQSSKKRGLEKLQRLEQRFGHSAVLETVSQEIENEIRMSCPRCLTELRKKDMVGHLWEKHRLVLDGQRVREPWRVIEDWAVDYGLEKDPHVLERCRELALKDDPRAGLARLQRMLYRRGMRDGELLSELRDQVSSRKATLCPHCFAALAIEPATLVQPLTLEPPFLKGYGYHLEVSERGLMPSLRIESPDAILFRGREPGRGLTRIGGILLLVIVLMACMYGLVALVTEETIPAVLDGSVALGVGLVWAGFLYLVWPNPRPAKDRLVKAAWKLLVPEILREEMGRREWSFLHGLVRISEEFPHHKVNEDLLLECCEQASEAARMDPLARICLASLSRCYITDMRERGADPSDFVLTLAAECFKGKLPLSFLGELLENFHAEQRAHWSKCDLNRLPILLAFQALLAEVDIDDWFSLGRAFSVVSAVLHLEQRWHWQQCFALWDQRSRRTWESAGTAKTMFGLAKMPKEFEHLLSFYPDVLLYSPSANLVVGSKGIWIEGVCIRSFQAGDEVSAQSISGGFELRIGALLIRCADNPRAYLDEVRRWLHWYFRVFVPSVSRHAEPLVESRHRMWQTDKITCPECSRSLVTCTGDLGVAVR